MKKFLLALFSESPLVSETRVMSMILVFMGCYTIIVGMNRTVIDYSGIAMLCTTIFGIAFAGKVTSKYAEVADHKQVASQKSPEKTNG